MSYKGSLRDEVKHRRLIVPMTVRPEARWMDWNSYVDAVHQWNKEHPEDPIDARDLHYDTRTPEQQVRDTQNLCRRLGFPDLADELEDFFKDNPDG